MATSATTASVVVDLPRPRGQIATNGRGDDSRVIPSSHVHRSSCGAEKGNQKYLPNKAGMRSFHPFGISRMLRRLRNSSSAAALSCNDGTEFVV
jgi:hypothetical protein